MGLCLQSWAALASAHPNHGPSWGERYLKIDAAADGVRVVYGITVSARFGNQLRASADADRNGQVDEGEVTTFGRGFADRLAKNVVLEVGGRASEEAWATPFIAGIGGRGARGPIAIETSTSVALPPGTQKLTIDDRAEFDGIYRTTAKISAAPGIALLKSGKGRAPSAQDLRLVFLDLPEDGPAPPRIITVELSVPGGERNGLAVWGIVVAAGVGFVVVVIAVALRRRRRRRVTAPGTDTGR
jgi:hypothetical protein